MGKQNSKFSEQVAVIAAINPQDAGTFTRTSAFVLADDFEKFGAVVSVGALEDTAKIYLLKADDTANGTTAAVTSAQVTTAQANKQVVLNADAEDFQDGTNKYVAVRVKCAADTANLISAVLLGVAAKYNPASDKDAASVVSIKN